MPPHTLELEQKQARFYSFAGFELDVTDEVLRRNGESLNISHRMFQVLLLLIERRGKTVEKEEFFEKVWAGNFVEDNNLTVTITALRKVLGDDAKQARFIKNIPRKGYRFIAEANSVYEPDVAGSNTNIRSGGSDDYSIRQFNSNERQQPQTNRSRSFWQGRSAKFSIALVSLSVFAILSLAVVRQNISWLSTGHTASRIDSIAVLPFQNLTSEKGYVAEGLTDGLIADLSRSADLRVIDRNSTSKYGAIDPASAGRELRARAVVTGTLQQEGDMLVITVDLLDLENNTQIWHQRYRRTNSEIFDTQRDISNTILQTIQFDRVGSTAARSSKRPTKDPEAYDLYLKGRYYWNKRTNEDLIRSVGYFKSAIDRDPTFAQAYVGLGNAYTLGDFTGITPDERVQLSRGAVQKALEIDDSLGEAYAALAINKCYHDWDLAAAESDYRRAIELNPNDATAHHWYAELLAMQGRFDESFSEYDHALSLDPLSLPIRTDRALNYYYARDYDTAISSLNKIREMEPEYERTYEFLQLVYREKGMFKEAADSLESMVDLQCRHGGRSTADQARFKKYVNALREGAARSGSDGFWRVVLATKIDLGPYFTGVAYAKLGDADKAFEHLERSFDLRYSGMVWLKVTPELDGLRSDQRFNGLVQRVGL